MLIVDILGLVLSGVAVISSGIALRYTHAQVKESRRANALLEEDLTRVKQRDETEARANRVRWQVEAHGSMTYVLRNLGTHEARDVKVSSGSVHFLSGPIAEHAFTTGGSSMLVEQVVPPGSGIKFTATDPSAIYGRGYELLVAWRGAGAPRAVAMPTPIA